MLRCIGARYCGNADGIAGTGVPSVDANGLVTTITYSTPINTDWQNPLEAACACGAKAPVLSKN